MAKRRRRLFLLSLSAPICASLASSDHVMRQTAIAVGDSVRSAVHHHVDGLAVQLTGNNTPATPAGLTQTPMAQLMETSTFSVSPCAITTAPILENYRRQVNDKAVTIIFLSSALSSASSHATAMSQSLASSISQLQASASVLSASASSAILFVQASASKAIEAAESSASDAVLLAEESASSRVSEILALASMTATPPPAPVNGTTYRAQALTPTESNSVSVAVVAIAVVASIVGSTLLSILGFYIFVNRRGAKKKKADEQLLEQQKQQEEEVHVSAALDRAIVSYIAKESPPTSPDSQSLGPSPTIEEVLSKEPRLMFLAPPPRSSHRPLPPTPPAPLAAQLTSPRSPPPRPHTHIRSHSTGSILAPPPRASEAPGGHTRARSTPKSPPRSPLRTPTHTAPPSPPGPPPTGPLPQLPSTTYVQRRPSRKKAARAEQEDRERVYRGILSRPLTNTTIPSPISPGAPVSPKSSGVMGGVDAAPGPDRRDSNWPLTGTQWL
ncbi:hypothetical protein B0T16DRAFT_213878 [Cercophora newfieldiana]|uniref:Transmembrane protein n=1 Tax=Cercophora newfieldiana TaxID=92897 RepID=A0AA40CL06_9PEZI|nr:hypothetical protein B0T16DRAFT_213878 [Cercophora newfieldiana]